MLSTFTVTNLDDSGDGSLRAAIASANDPLLHPGADEIVFAPGLRGTITLTGGELAITDALTIDGPGAGTLAVSGNDVSRVFRVGASVAATIEDLTITRGLTHTPGGGILNQGILTLEDDVVSSNQVVGDLGQTVGGGGIANINGATLTIRDSTFRDNRARGGDGRGLGQAGAISTPAPRPPLPWSPSRAASSPATRPLVATVAATVSAVPLIRPPTPISP